MSVIFMLEMKISAMFMCTSHMTRNFGSKKSNVYKRNVDHVNSQLLQPLKCLRSFVTNTQRQPMLSWSSHVATVGFTAS